MSVIRSLGHRRLALVVPALGIAAVAAGVALAAGSSSTSASKAARGGTITVLSAGDVDHIDPGQAYYSFAYAGRQLVFALQFGLRTSSISWPGL